METQQGSLKKGCLVCKKKEVDIKMINSFDRALGLDAAQALAMLAMSYQVRPKIEGEYVKDVPEVSGLYIIPDICMGKGDDAEEYSHIMGYLLDFNIIRPNRVDEYLRISLDVVSKYLFLVKEIIKQRYNVIPLSHFQFLVERSICVRKKCRNLFAKGLYYGYLGDYYVASCLLVPLLEAFFRDCIVANGISITDKNQRPLGLGVLLDKEEVKKIFSEGVYFEIRALLSRRQGLNLRNLIAHGDIDDEKSCGMEFFFVWWFSLRLVVNLGMREGAIKDSDYDDRVVKRQKL